MHVTCLTQFSLKTAPKKKYNCFGSSACAFVATARSFLFPTLAREISQLHHISPGQHRRPGVDVRVLRAVEGGQRAGGVSDGDEEEGAGLETF